MKRAARSFDVVVVEEPLFGDWPSGCAMRESDGVRIAVPHLPSGRSAEEDAADLERQVAAIIDAGAHEAGGPIFWYYTPAAMAFSGRLARALTIFDNMDELSAFHGASPALLQQERDLLAAADLVFTGGWSLFEAKRARHGSVHCFPSSVDAAHFAQARDRSCRDPDDQRGIAQPRLGFFGVIDERMDLDFLVALAALRPDWQFIMIGPVVKIDPASLPRSANIHWLGMQSYADLPNYMAHWDLGLMPFALNEATRFISPTKTPEYLAGGLRVISTPVADVVRAYGDDGLVAIAATPAEAARMGERLLARRDADFLARVDARLRMGSWDATWQAMHDLMEDGLARGERPGPDRSASATSPA